MSKEVFTHPHVPGNPGDTFQESVSDTTVYNIPRADLKIGGGTPVVGALIHIQGNNGRFAFGVDPAQDGLGVPLTDGNDIILASYTQVQKFGLVCDVSASSLTAMITLFYED